MKSVFTFTALISIGVLFSFSLAKKPSEKKALKVLDGFCSYVSSGDAVVEGDTVSVQSFYMSSTEITNFQYKEFLFYLKDHGQMEKYKIAQVDSTLWRTEMGWEDNKYAEFYSTHPAYRDYPVVNITKAGAELYCEWLTMMYQGISGGELNLKFRIPTRAEWMRAARGNNHHYNYTWAGPRLRNSEGKQKANHLQLGEWNITRNPITGALEEVSAEDRLFDNKIDGNADVTAPCESYWPNELGFYNINGNVAEMISDSDHAVGGDWFSYGADIRNESIKEFKGAHPTVGFRVVATYSKPVK